MCLVAAWELGLRNRRPPKEKRTSGTMKQAARPMPPARNMNVGERLAALRRR
jgi:hypothetical protein